MGNQKKIAITDMARLLKDFSGEHAPCVFKEIGETFGNGCKRNCAKTPDCWERFILWWMENKRKEQEDG